MDKKLKSFSFMKIGNLLLMAVLLGFLVQVVYYYPRVPIRIAVLKSDSFFLPYNQVWSWINKDQFLINETIGIIIFVLLGIIVPIFILKIPKKRINLPNKEYWLDSSRENETREDLGSFLRLIYGVIALEVLIYSQLIYQCNITLNYKLISQASVLSESIMWVLFLPIIIPFVIKYLNLQRFTQQK